MKIDRITGADRDAYLKMASEFYCSEAVSHPVGRENFVRAFDYFVSDGTYSQAFLLREDGNPIGYGIVCFGYSQEAGGKTVLFDELYITEGCRGRGYGRAFFDYIFAEYPAARYRLEVDPRNARAEKLYKRLGFVRLGYRQFVKDNRYGKI